MRKQLFIMAAAGLTLVSAHPPQSQDLGRATAEARRDYPPCSKTVTDRCIQLHERGVRSAANLARNTSTGATTAAVRPADDDIDVTYAGDLRAAPPALAERSVPQAAPQATPAPLRRAEAPQVPARARQVRVARLAADPAAASAYPACRSGVTDRCRQVPARKPARLVSMRVKRAGERG